MRFNQLFAYFRFTFGATCNEPTLDFNVLILCPGAQPYFSKILFNYSWLVGSLVKSLVHCCSDQNLTLEVTRYCKL